MVPLINPSVFLFLPTPCWFYYCNSLVQLKIWGGNTSSRSFITQECFSHPGFLCFHIKLKIVFSKSGKSCVKFWWQLHWICRLLLVGHFYYINPTNSMSMGDHSIFWYLLQFLFKNVLMFFFFNHASFSLAWLELPEDILYYWSYREGVFSIISFYVFFSFLYRRATKFCEFDYVSSYFAKSVYQL